MAIACLRLFTLRPEPLLSVPFLLRRIADLTLLAAALPYFAMGFNAANGVLRSRESGFEDRDIPAFMFVRPVSAIDAD
jgi:hypothetical protein